MRKAALVVYGAVLLGLCAWKAYEIYRPHALEKISRLPDLEATALTPTTTRPWTPQSMEGKVWVANFIFTACAGPCPTLSGRMAELRGELPENVALVTFTVDPETDTAERLRDYGEKFGADFERWTFVRTEKAQLYRLVFEGFRMEVAGNPAGAEGARVLHSTRFALVDGRGYVRGLYDSERDSYRKFLKEDALRVLKETI